MPATNVAETNYSQHKKFLLLEPSYGGNNQFYAIVEALVWARILQRHLIVPPIFLPRVSEFDSDIPFEEWPDTQSILQFGDTDELIRSRQLKDFPLHHKLAEMVSFKDWMNSKKKSTLMVSRILRISRDAIFDHPSRKLTELMDPEGKIVTVNLRHLFEKKLSTKEVLQYLGGCQKFGKRHYVVARFLQPLLQC